MQIAIVEDNTAEAKLLKEQVLRLLPEEYGIPKIDLYPGANKFINTDKYYELIFIDCLLPDVSGVELAKTIRRTNKTSGIIFTTAYIDYAVEGYEADVKRYLLKPIEDEKLLEALQAFSHGKKSDTVTELTGTTRYATYAQINDIFYVEYVGRKIIVRLEGRSVESHITLKEFESYLGPEFFFRTSQRFLVNFNHIIGKSDNVLTMRNGEKVTISGRKLSAFNQAYIKYLKRG